MSAFDVRTVQFYEGQAAEYAEWSGRGRSFAFLDRLIAALSPRSRVLDAGCGAGWDSERMAAAGFHVVSIDASRRLVSEANRRSGVSAIHKRFDELRGCGEFDAVWANSTLQHVPRSDLPSVLNSLSDAIKPGGLFFTSVHSGLQTRRDSLDRLYCHYPRLEFSKLLGAASLEVTSIHTAKGAGYDGSPTESLLVESRKKESSEPR